MTELPKDQILDLNDLNIATGVGHDTDQVLVGSVLPDRDVMVGEVIGHQLSEIASSAGDFAASLGMTTDSFQRAAGVEADLNEIRPAQANVFREAASTLRLAA